MMLCLFVIVTLIMVLLPLVPALSEWYRPTDAQPLRVVRDYDGSAEHFAVRFREFINEKMGAAFEEAAIEPKALYWGTLKGGGSTLLIGRAQVLPTDLKKKNREIGAVIAALGSVTLPQNVFFKSEVYARGDIHVGDRTACRAILSEGDLTLGSGCAVLRWAHAERDVATGSRARLWGRLTAGQTIILGEESVFTRLHAPRIVTGAVPPVNQNATDAQRTVLAMPDDVHFHSTNRWMTRKSLTVPAQTQHSGDLIAEGALTVGRASHIAGSLKTHKAMTIEEDSVIEGSIIAMKDLAIEAHCTIAGPVVGEATVTIARGCVIGSKERPTTITAPRIRLAPGVVIYGSVWSREDGHVLAADTAASRDTLAEKALQLAPAT